MNSTLAPTRTLTDPQLFVDIALAFEDAHATLVGTHNALLDASDRHAQAKYDLEQARAVELYEGNVPGKNAEQREAILRLDLRPLYITLMKAERGLAEAKMHHECARLEWDSLRYRLQAYQMAATLEHKTE
jgi:hypothetical protein